MENEILNNDNLIEDENIKQEEKFIKDDFKIEIIEKEENEEKTKKIDDEDDENTKLISEEEKKEKTDLYHIFKRLKKDLKSKEYETLNQIYENYINNEDITKRSIKPNSKKFCLALMYFIVSPVFGIINLVGIFEIITILKIIFQILKNAVIFYFRSIQKDPNKIKVFSINEFNSYYNFYGMFFDYTKNEFFDFNLMMFTGFLGTIILQSRGFIQSTLILSGINALSILLILIFSFLNYNIEDSSYSIFQIIHLLICWIILFIGVGASTLISQQIIIDYNFIYTEYLISNNKTKEKKWEQKRQKMMKRNGLKIQENEKLSIEQKNDEEIIYIKNKDNENETKEKEEETKKENENELKEENKEKEKGEIEINENKENEDKKKEDKEKNECKNKDNDNQENETKEKDEEENNIIKEKNEENNYNLIEFHPIVDNIEEVQEKPKDLNKEEIDVVNNKTEENVKNENMEKNLKIENKKEIKKNKFDSFFIICLVTIFGYFLKYIINYIIMDYNNNNLDEYMEIAGCFNDTICYENILKDSNLSITNKTLFETLRKKIFKDDYYSFFFIIIIYGGCMTISIFLYLIFFCVATPNKKEENNNKNKYRVCEIFGYVIYSENILLKETPCCECCIPLGNTCKNCICILSKSLLNNLFIFCKCCSGCRKCFNCLPSLFCEVCCEDSDTCCCCNIQDCKNWDCGTYLYCCCCCCCCDCCGNEDCLNCCLIDFKCEDDGCRFGKCCDYGKEEYKKNNECFCYCYKAKRTTNWLNKFLTSDTQKTIFPVMFEYFILQLLTIAFEKQYIEFGKLNSNADNKIKLFTNNYKSSVLETEGLYTFLTFSLTFLIFFYSTISYYTFVNINWPETGNEEEFEDSSKIKQKKRKYFGRSQIANKILIGIHGILLFNGLFSIIFSSLYFNNSENDIFKNSYLFLIPFLMNRFFCFTLNYYCISYSEDKKKKFELISGSTLISIYLYLWNTIISLIRDYTPINILYKVQIITCIYPGYISFLIVCMLFLLFCMADNCRKKSSLFCCFCSFLLCFGGFWFSNELFENFYYKKDETKNGCFCGICNLCHCCDCCDCCECYDCLECCTCCYCCGDEYRCNDC